MKWILYLFLAANLLTFAWFSLNPELRSGPLEVMDPVATPGGVGTIRLLSEYDPVIKVASGMPLQSQPVGMCHTIGPFRDHGLAENALARIAELGREGTVRPDTVTVKTGYWVYLKSMQGQEVERVIQELQEKGIRDYHKTERNELSLGIYNGLKSAERRQKSIAALGYSPLVGSLSRNRTRYWVDVAEMKRHMLADDAWHSIVSGFPGSQRQSQACDLVNT